MPILTLQNIGRRVNGVWAVWDVTLEIEPGEILAILGRSGSGKSSLAGIVAGLDAPTSGTIRFGGDTPQYCPSIAMQQPAIAPDLTLYENLTVTASLWRMARRRRSREISFVLELLGLSDRRQDFAAQLSLGELRRLEIARAILADSPLLVIDSLLDTLDKSIYDQLWDHLMGVCRKQGKAMLVLTGSGSIAESCSRMAVMHRGRVVYAGRPDDFRRIAGEDMVVLGDIGNPILKHRIKEKFSMVIQEEDGFLSFRVGHGERVVTDLLSEYGSELSCVYLKRPTIDDALEVLANGEIQAISGAGNGVD